MSKLNSDLQALVARFEEGVSADPTQNMSPEDAAKWKAMNEEHGDKFKTASDILKAIHRGDKVTITTPRGQQVTGTAALKGPYGWVLNMGAGGARTAIATDDNIVKVVPSKRAAHVYLVNVNHNNEPIVDGHLDPILMGMILTKVTGRKTQGADPNKAILEPSPTATRTVSVGGILTTWDKALKGALLEHPEMFTKAGRAFRVEINVGSIYEKGMKAAEGEDAKEGKFEEGVSADPTKDMSPEDAAEWKKQNEANKDKFKAASPLEHLAALDLELTAASLPATEQGAHLAMLDRVADAMIGRTILEQMGGQRRLQVMLGVQQINLLPNGVGIKWPNKQASKGNYVEIKLNGADLYDVEFFNVNSMTKKSVKKYDDIYAEDLKDLFERQTGWYLRMASEQAHHLVMVATTEGPLARFEEGVSADPTKDMSPEDAAEWKKNTEKHKDKFKTAAQHPPKDSREQDLADELAREESLAELKKGAKDKPDAKQLLHYGVTEDGWKRAYAEALRQAEAKAKKASEGILAEGCPENLDESECKEWEANTEKYKDVVKDQANKTAATFKFRVPVGPTAVKEVSAKLSKAGIKSEAGTEHVHGTIKADDEDAAAAALNKAAGYKIVADRDITKFLKTAYEEGSRVPDGWDNGHIEGEPDTDKPGDEGSDVPDGNGNQHKRAGEVIDEMYALLSDEGEMYGATDDLTDARNKGYWARTVFGNHIDAAGLKLMTLVNVPLSLAEKFKDVGTSAQKFPDGYAAWAVAKRFVKGTAFRLAAADKEAGTGLYGHTKRLQADCEGCVRRVQKTAAQIAKRAYGKHEAVAEFLSVHAKRADSLPAQILVAALGEMGPRVARQMRLAELRDASKAVGEYNEFLQAQQAKAAKVLDVGVLASVLWEKLGDEGAKLASIAPEGLHFAAVLTAAEDLKTAGFVTFDGVTIAKVTDADSQTGEGVTQTTDKTAKSYGLYGFGEKVAQLGLQACTELRHEAGKTAYDLHSRRTAHHAAINDFFTNHSKQAKCMYSKLLAASYPDLPQRKAALAPTSVQGWLTWDRQ